MEYSVLVDDTDIENLDELPDMDNLTIAEQAKSYPPRGWIPVYKTTTAALERISDRLSTRGRFYPERKCYLFHIFRICPLANVRVVIIGQDPYPDPYDAYGLAFSTPPGGRIRPSLNMIYKELEQEYEDFTRPKDGYLLPWVEQGVFLLNYCLTYHPDDPLKPSEMDVWMPFITKVIDAICVTNPNAVFVLWGKKAEALTSRIKGCKIITGPHPSPIGGQRFLGCGHFQEVNDYLVTTGQNPIDWRL
jgi:uracil-DNA glycosylase